MLRITQVNCDDGRVVLKLEGRLVDRWVDLLRETWEVLHREVNTPVILDMSEVGFASREGIKLLRYLEEQGVRCILCSPFLKELVRSF